MSELRSPLDRRRTSAHGTGTNKIVVIPDPACRGAASIEHGPRCDRLVVDLVTGQTMVPTEVAPGNAPRCALVVPSSVGSPVSTASDSIMWRRLERTHLVENWLDRDHFARSVEVDVARATAPRSGSCDKTGCDGEVERGV
jgi:hypothetical protein